MMRKMYSIYLLSILMLVATMMCLSIFENVFVRHDSPVALMVVDFAESLL